MLCWVPCVLRAAEGKHSHRTGKETPAILTIKLDVHTMSIPLVTIHQQDRPLPIGPQQRVRSHQRMSGRIRNISGGRKCFVLAAARLHPLGEIAPAAGVAPRALRIPVPSLGGKFAILTVSYRLPSRGEDRWQWRLAEVFFYRGSGNAIDSSAERLVGYELVSRMISIYSYRLPAHRHRQNRTDDNNAQRIPRDSCGGAAWPSLPSRMATRLEV
jgi:hypothetical protein